MNRANQSAAILAIARNLRTKTRGCDELADRALREDWSVEKFREAALERLGVAPIRSLLHDLPSKDAARYSFCRVLQAGAMGVPLDGLEREVSDECTRKLGSAPRGTYVDPDILARNYVAATPTLGGFLVGTGVGDFIDVLRQKSLMLRLGAQAITLDHPMRLPKMNSSNAAQWVTSTNAPTLTGENMLAYTASPHICAAINQYDNGLIAAGGANPQIDAMVVNELFSTTGLALDTAALQGTGSGGQPTGILNTAGIQTVSAATDGTTLSFPFLCSLAELPALAGADSTNWILHPTDRTRCWKTAKFSSGSEPILGNDGKILGANVDVHNALNRTLTSGTASGIACWQLLFSPEDMVISRFGALDVFSDPITQLSNGVTRALIRGFFDTTYTQPARAAVGLGVLS